MPITEKSIDVEGVRVPIKIYIEKRRSVRVSFGKNNINLRMPLHLSESARNSHYEQAVEWIYKKAKQSPSLLTPYVQKDYGRAGSFTIFDREIKYKIDFDPRKSGKADYLKRSNTILLTLPNEIEGFEKQKMIKRLFSKICAQLFLPEIKERVFRINEECFHKEIKSVNLKYNQSNWGSCSSANNINLSTRLLFAPAAVRDYVIVHELAHLYEMNHSPKFWNIVSQVMPTYKDKEMWLKNNGHLCDF